MAPIGRCLAPLVVLTSFVGSRILAQPQEASVTEYQVKAAFLYSFAKFVEWPSDAAGRDRDTFVICILGEDPFDGTLDQLLRGKTAEGKKIAVRRVARTEDVGHSEILFISDSEKERLPRILKGLEGAATLTVGEMDHFAERGGVVRFRMERNRVRLEINVANAEQARLKISSELLKLARIVPTNGAD